MSPSFSFPPQARLRREAEFRRVYARGIRRSVFPLRFRALVRAEGQSRLGLAIGRKVGGAVVRNRWKRAIREAFRLNRHRLRKPWDLVVGVDWTASRGDVRQVEAAFLALVDFLNDAEQKG